MDCYNCKCSDVIVRSYQWKEFWPKYPETRKIKVGVIIEKDNQVLLVQNCGNKWSIPKGGVYDLLNPPETIEAGAIREIEEETGIKIDINKLERINKTWIDSKGILSVFKYTLPDDYEVKLIDNCDEISGVTLICKKCIKKIRDKQNFYGYKAINKVSRSILKYVKII